VQTARETLPMSFVATCMLPLVGQETLGTKVGVFVRASEAESIFRVDATALQSLDLSNFLESLKGVLRTMNARLKQVRDERKSLYISA